MCGLAGKLGQIKENRESASPEFVLRHLLHRGPDSSGFLNLNHGTFYHTRLSIIDLRPCSDQPFTKRGSSIVFNGEIYNFKELKDYLISKGCTFDTNSDTEVLLEGMLTEGSNFLIKIRGMFAFVMWDNVKKIFLGSRDRFGEKPLYFAFLNKSLLFASEFRCLRKMLGGPLEMDVEALNLFLHYQFIPENFSIDSRIQKLTPGTYFTFNPIDSNLTFGVYWTVPSDAYSESADEPSSTLSSQIVSDLKELLIQSVERCLVADVPIAFALSGGIDSSAIAGIARLLQPKSTFEAFSVNYEEEMEIDESKQAEWFANLLKFSLNRITISTSEFVENFSDLVNSLDEPIADPAAYSHFRIPQLVSKKGYKILLNGIGGDEFFWGYYWLPLAQKTNLQIMDLHRDKSLKRKFIEFLMGSSLDKRTRKSYLYFYEVLSEFTDVYSLKETCLSTKFKSNSKNFELSIPGALPRHNRDVPIRIQKSLIETWLVSNCLNLSDRVGMYHGVESRMPFLDGDLTEYLLNLTRRGITTQHKEKQLLKLSLAQLLPKEILNRPKNGFRIPNNKWMKALIETKFESLEDGYLAGNGLLNIDGLRALKSSTEMEKWRNQFFIYKLLVFDGILQLND